MRATVLVRPKAGILDPQGQAVEASLRQLGFRVDEARIGRVVDLELDAEDPSAARVVTVDNQPAVQLDDDFDRAWRRVGLSLDRIFGDMPNVPFKDNVWPKFLRENAIKVFKLDQ